MLIVLSSAGQLFQIKIKIINIAFGIKTLLQTIINYNVQKVAQDMMILFFYIPVKMEL
jgi:hypothetical protein